MWQSDDQWVRRCLGEQPDAFRHLVERHEGRPPTHETLKLANGLSTY